jgi:hypothetical protein
MGVWSENFSYIFETLGSSNPPEQVLILSARNIKALAHDFF